VLVPHIVRTQNLEPSNLRTIDTGVGQSIELRHVTNELPSAAPAVPAARPAVKGRPNFGTVPGQSAQDAAPTALAEMMNVAHGNGTPPAPSASQPTAVRFQLAAQPGPVAAGSTFKVPVVLSGGNDIASVPLQIQYDATKLSLVNVDSGDFLSRDGQAVALVHRDEGPGEITVNVSRPPGAVGVSGSGVVFVLTFQAKAAGESALVITRPAAVTSTQQQVPAQGARTSILVQ
jgi:general secretion pathway protein D